MLFRSMPLKMALCVGITNTVGSAMANNTHYEIHINAGCEKGVVSTKVNFTFVHVCSINCVMSLQNPHHRV